MVKVKSYNRKKKKSKNDAVYDAIWKLRSYDFKGDDVTDFMNDYYDEDLSIKDNVEAFKDIFMSGYD